MGGFQIDRDSLAAAGVDQADDTVASITAEFLFDAARFRFNDARDDLGQSGVFRFQPHFAWRRHGVKGEQEVRAGTSQPGGRSARRGLRRFWRACRCRFQLMKVPRIAEKHKSGFTARKQVLLCELTERIRRMAVTCLLVISTAKIEFGSPS